MQTQIIRITLFLIFFVSISFGYAQNYTVQQWRTSFDEGMAYVKAKEWNKAQKQLEESYIIASEVFKKEQTELDITAYNLGMVLRKNGNSNAAIAKLSLSADIRSKREGVYSKNFEKNLVVLASCYTDIRDFKKSNELYTQVLEILNFNNKKLSKNYIEIQRYIASNYISLEENQSAIQTLKEGLDIIERAQSKTDIEYAENLRRIAKIYFDTNQVEVAKSTINEALAILQNHSNFDQNRLVLYKLLSAQIHFAEGNFMHAELILKDLLTAQEALGNTQRASYYLILHELAKTQLKQGQYNQALTNLNQSRAGLDKKSVNYYIVTTDLALAYENLGKDDKAIEIYIDLLESLPSNNSNYLNVLQGLALIYTKLGDYTNAKALYDRALVLIDTDYKQKNSLTACKLINNAGKLYYQLKDYNKANDYYKEALDLFLITHNEDHFDYGYMLADYAFAQFSLGNTKNATEILINNLAIDERNNRQNSESYANKQYQLATIYNRTNEFEKALLLLLSSQTIIKELLGKTHSDYGYVLVELSKTYAELNAIQKSIPYIEEANQLFLNQLSYNFKFRTENEKKLFVDKLIGTFDTFQQIGLKANNRWPAINEINLNNQLVLKGLLLSNSTNIMMQLESLNSEDIKVLLNDYSLQKADFNKLTIKSNNKSTQQFIQKKQQLNDLELQLVKAHTKAFDNKMDFSKNWKSSRERLKEGEIAIEFSTIKDESNTTYAAYIFDNQAKQPLLVPLCSETLLTKLLEEKTPSVLYSSRGSKGNAKANSEALYDLIWKPLHNHLINYSKIFYAPSGLLYKVSFAALGNKEKGLLCDQHDLIRLSSTSILESESDEPQLQNFLLVGGVDYDYSLIKKGEQIERNELNKKWPYLEGTLQEIDAISTLLKTNNYNTNTLTSTDATEYAFTNSTKQGYDVIHLATHGYFYNKNASEVYQSTQNSEMSILAKDPLLRSGIILAGANTKWNATINKDPSNDGVLTALEIAGMDLHKTDVVVLSACETGLGDINGSEGVYGLQRAFKIAGVDHLIMSLWEVPDKETAEFMTMFYRYWIDSQSMRNAFNKAQRDMATHYKDSPSKWAAFVLVQ